MNKIKPLTAKQTTDHDIFRKLSNDRIVNLQFTDLLYKVNDGAKNSKVLLDGVSGEFRAGELTAIIGPSGCGKTTLINLLSGYRIHRTSGHVYINGKPQGMKVFRKMSRYVLQFDDINPYFTVMETMMFASKLKLDSHYTEEYRRTVIEDILKMFYLYKQANTMISQISGGERKRVCVALELLDNPSVLFLDEPTTGLDEVSASRCIGVLKQLAKFGHTIICSLHCPSARLFQTFDKVYAMAHGQCIYQGAAHHIVPYLKRFDLHCPVTYNPADFIIEVAIHAYGNFQDDMVHEINNGKIMKWLPDSEFRQTQKLKYDKTSLVQMDLKMSEEVFESEKCSWWSEYKWILLRFMQDMWRDQTKLKIRFLVDIIVALLISLIYQELGHNARLGLYNTHFAIALVVKIAFTSMAHMLAHVPQHVKYLRREHFNQWYSLSSYFMALLTSELPILGLMTVISSALVYYLTGQPMELFRFILFVGITVLTSLMASSYGLFVGSRFNMVNALFLGNNIMGVWINLAGISAGNDNLSTFQKIAMHSSCLRYPFEGIVATLLKYNRADFVCPTSEIVCLMSKPQYILKFTNALNANYAFCATCTFGFYVLFTGLAFVVLKYRLSGYNLFTKSRNIRYVKHLFMKYI